MSTTGVRLTDGTSGWDRGSHVHRATKDWSITSAYSVDDTFDATTPILTVTLPGRLGTYVYPADAVFHVHGRDATMWRDFETIRAGERRGVALESRINPRSVSVHAEYDDADDEEEDMGDDVDECDEGDECDEVDEVSNDDLDENDDLDILEPIDDDIRAD